MSTTITIDTFMIYNGRALVVIRNRICTGRRRSVGDRDERGKRGLGILEAICGS
jgi:hypothetical protein